METVLPIAVAASLIAGGCFALAGVLQQEVASGRPEEEAMSFRLLKALARQPMWLGGIMLAMLAYAFQALALAFGPLSLVQPLIVSELLFAIPLSARLHRMRLHSREWLGAGAVTGGLALALVAARPSEGDPVASALQWLITLTAIGTVIALVLAGSRYVGEPVRTSLIALAGGATMGTQSALLAATIHVIPEGAAAVFTAWETYLLVATSAAGLLLIQSAFQAGPLSASLPVIDATEPVVAATIGVVLFEETIRLDWASVLLGVIGATVLLGGIVLLDTSPLLKALHERERREQQARQAQRNGRQRSGDPREGDGDECTDRPGHGPCTGCTAVGWSLLRRRPSRGSKR